MPPKKHSRTRRTHLREPANIPILIMRHISDDNVIDTDYVDEYSGQRDQRLHDRFRDAPRNSQYTPPPHNNVPAKPWHNNKFGWSNTPGSDQADYQTGQPGLGNVPHFIHVEEDMLGEGLKGAFFLSRRMVIVILFLFSLMIIGAQSVPDILELVFSFI